MFLTSLLLTLAPAHTTPIQGNRREEVKVAYHALAEARDAEGLQKLWKDNVGLVLQTIDADLEGGLSLWEKSKDSPPEDKIAALQDRAMYGARMATKALDQPIFLDYAASFIGWTDDQKLAFRSGQAVYGRAMQELKKEEYEVAYEAGMETVERASALGDWWGLAMGYGAKGEAARQMGEFEDALNALSMARQINHALGLQFSEYRNLQSMLNVARADERLLRALVTAEAVIEFAEAFQDSDTLKATLATKGQIEDSLGLAEDAEATRSKLEKLAK
ncbi:MAG: tetratricopeptide (TPR) repeat protein [Planctomycetota bacterium]|jgi:tetratricopeptide (TPR) repeat protein